MVPIDRILGSVCIGQLDAPTGCLRSVSRSDTWTLTAVEIWSRVASSDRIWEDEREREREREKEKVRKQGRDIDWTERNLERKSKGGSSSPKPSKFTFSN